jgi:hypothetical protein
MVLEFTQIVDLIKNPPKKNEIEQGKIYESRLRVLTESKFENDLKSETGFKKFKKTLESRLKSHKAERIENFFSYPLPVVNLSTSVLKELYKVFDAGNSFFNVEFMNAQQKKSIEPILMQTDIVKWIIDEGKEVLRNEPNKIVVIDKDEKGNPYILDIDSERLIDFKIKEDAELEYVIFVHSIEEENNTKIIKYAVYDDMKYSVVECKNDTFTMLSENAHNLEYCPARFFICEELNSNSEFSRNIPLAKAISKLEEWQCFDTFKHYVDYYAPFPVMEAPESNCSVENCVSGHIHTPQDYEEDGILKTRTIISDCPACSKKDLIGPGTVIRIPAKQEKDDPTEAGVFKMISNSVENLNYLKEKLSGIEDYIFNNVVGIDKTIQKQSVNELQMKGSYDTKENVLLSIKSEFDNLYIWIVKTISKLVVKGVEMNVSANFGTEFYLLTESDLQDRFENAKKIGLPEIEVDAIFKQLIDTKYRGNQNKIERSLIVKYLDPAPYKTITDCITLFEKGLMTQDDLILKTELINFVDRFEMENLPLNEFGVNLALYQRITKIKEIFNTYINESRAKQV